ncbi:MAG: Cell division protein FtsZ [Actinobacteria bacterium ADurb.Bin346]|nr:MAG: Cell division protein FtsZ [Actinobacteria bacterium ADurb.Bin346]
MHEVNEAAEVIRNAASADANIIFGAVIDETINDKLKVTIIAAGFKDRERFFEKPFIPEEKISDLEKDTAVEKILSDSEFPETGKKPAAEKTYENRYGTDDFKTIEEDDYLDVPTFLRKNREK